MWNWPELKTTTEIFKKPQIKNLPTGTLSSLSSRISYNSIRSVSSVKKINLPTWSTISIAKTSILNQTTTDWLSSLMKMDFSASRFETWRTYCYKVPWKWINAKTSFYASAAKRTYCPWRCGSLGTKTRPYIAWNLRRMSKLAAGGKVITSVADDYVHFLDPSQSESSHLTPKDYQTPWFRFIDGSI